MTVHVHLFDTVLVAAMARHPGNMLSQPVRDALAAAIARADTDDAITALVIASDLPVFSTGLGADEEADLHAQSELADLCTRLADCRVPTVAVVAGKALAGGCELALACDYRLASRDAVFALPQVRMGLVPAAGGTQRLPRIVGLTRAAEIIATARIVTGAEALDWGLVDKLVDNTSVVEWVGLASPLARNNRRACSEPVAPDEAEIAALSRKVAAKARGQIAPTKAIELVSLAARLTLHDGLAEERRVFAQLAQGTERRALAYVRDMRRALAEHPEFAGITARPVTRVGIVGAGQMGSGIALAMLHAGYEVLLYDSHSLEPGLARIRAGILRRIEKAGDSPQAADAVLSRLHPVASLDGMADADLVIEGVIERMDVKRELFAGLERVVGPQTVLATNTSYLDVDAMGAGLGDPSRLVGMHFFNPADVMKLLEVVRADASAPEAVATALEVGRKMGKVCVVTRVCDGFVGNRIFKKYKEQAEFLVQEGAEVEAVDAAMRDFGFPMGPLQVCDLAGLDIGWHNRRREDALRDPAERYSTISDRLYDAGRMGRKSGAGWYRYTDGKAVPDPEVAGIVAASAREAGLERRAIDRDEIVDRLLAVMIREGRAIMDEGIVARAVEVDGVLLNGYGFPAAKGGPMFWAAQLGEERVAAMIAAVERAEGLAGVA